MTISKYELDAIEARADAANPDGHSLGPKATWVIDYDIPTLVAEVRALAAEVSARKSKMADLRRDRYGRRWRWAMDD